MTATKSKIRERKPAQLRKLRTTGLSNAQALKVAGDLTERLLARSKAIVKTAPFSDSFTTEDASFSVEVKLPWGACIEDVEVRIDCGGMIHGDVETIDVLIEMLEHARDNLLERQGPHAVKAYWAKGT